MNQLEKIYFDKIIKAYELYKSSVVRLSKVDISKLETPQELEVLDAFSSRFEKLIEIIIWRFTKTIESIETWTNNWTIRDRLNLMEKKWYITNIDIWLDMRWVRNKIAYEYLENYIYDFYNIVMEEYEPEIEKFMKFVKNKFSKDE